MGARIGFGLLCVLRLDTLRRFCWFLELGKVYLNGGIWSPCEKCHQVRSPKFELLSSGEVGVNRWECFIAVNAA